jgi:hypothetical protein
MKRFKSKIGKGFVLFPSLILIAVALLLIVEKAWLGLPILIAIAIYLTDIFINTHYSIEDGVLTIDAGRFYSLQIPISNIYKIKSSRDPSKAPANSIDAYPYAIQWLARKRRFWYHQKTKKDLCRR